MLGTALRRGQVRSRRVVSSPTPGLPPAPAVTESRIVQEASTVKGKAKAKEEAGRKGGNDLVWGGVLLPPVRRAPGGAEEEEEKELSEAEMTMMAEAMEASRRDLVRRRREEEVVVGAVEGAGPSWAHRWASTPDEDLWGISDEEFGAAASSGGAGSSRAAENPTGSPRVVDSGVGFYVGEVEIEEEEVDELAGDGDSMEVDDDALPSWTSL